MRFGEFAQRAVTSLGATARTSIDGTIELFFPGWALRRVIARSKRALLKEMRHLGHSLQNPINDQSARARRRGFLGPLQETRVVRAQALVVARDLYARNPWAVGAVNSITGNVIGKGMQLESAILTQGGDNAGLPNQQANQAVEQVWKRWAKGADLTGKRSFMGMQRIAYRERWVSNDVFVRRHTTPGKEVPLSIEVVQPELLNTEAPGSVQGITFTSTGQISGYNFFRSREDQTNEFVSADNVIHFFRPNQPGSVRGISPMAPVARTFDALDTYLNHELTRAGIASAFVLLHKTGGKGMAPGLQDGEGTETDDEGNPVVNVAQGGGIVMTGGKDDALDFAAPSIQSTAFDPFVRLVLRAIATAMGISYELLARDFTKTNFSSSRSANLEDRRQWEPEQEEFINQVLNVVWTWFVDAAQMARVQPFASQRAEFPVLWIPQGWLWIDPQKEATATSLAIEMGLDNPFDAARRLGRDLPDNLRKKAAAERLAEELGTTIKTSAAPPPQPETDDVDDEDEAEETGEGEEDGDGRRPRRLVA